MPPTMQQTSLPALHTSRILNADVDGVRRHHWSKKLPGLPLAAAQLESHLIAAFLGFIRLLLGGAQDDVCFLLLSEAVISTVFSSRVDELDAIERVEKIEEVPSDFVLDLRRVTAASAEAETTNADRTFGNKKLVACVSSGDGDHQIELEADATSVPAKALKHLADLFCHQIHDHQDREDGFHLSILNHPPRERPIPFPQEPDIQKYPALLHGCFERRVAQYPERVAVDFLTFDHKRQQYSYHEVDTIASRIAATLSNGNGHDRSPVAIVMGPSPEMYISYLATLKSGRPFCPIPVDAPVERQLMILEDLEASAILTRSYDSSLALFASLRDKTHASIINASDYLEAGQSDAPRADIDESLTPHGAEDDLAYIMYTSGTTGKPKGVQISHLSAACSIAAHSAVAPLSSTTDDPPTKWFQFAAPTFDPSIMEIFVTLSGGGTLCTAERQLTLDDINGVLSQMKVDVMMATPSLASLLDPKQLKSLWTMGEALSTRVIGNFSGHNPDADDEWSPATGPRGLYNAYGPTEAAINCTLLPHVPVDNRGSVLGPALPSCSLIIVDESDHSTPVPWGCVGELLIAGPQVSSRGYLNRPEETARAFLPCTPWGRAYRTGDRARIIWDRNGEPSVEFLGRISSDQVKLSGRRVELGEIDAVITRVEAVREALTVVYKPHGSETGGSEKPVTAVSLVDDRADWDAVRQEIINAVQKDLPSFMRPYRIFLEQQLPRSAAGKLDRKALTLALHGKLEDEANSRTLQVASQVDPDAEMGPQVTEAESKLLDVLADIMGFRPSATSDLVQDVGLDSLRAMQLLSRVREHQLMDSISLHDLLSGRSVRQLLGEDTRQSGSKDTECQQLIQQFSTTHSTTACELAGLRTQDVDKVLPSTATQSGMIASFMRSSHGSQKTYINHSCYHLNSDSLDVDRFVAAIEETLLSREAFRTTFVPVDDSLAPFAQCIISHEVAQRDGKWCRVVRREGSASQAEGYWLEQAESEISLESNVLYQFQVVDNSTLVISLLHGIFDGASLELLLVDIERCYHGLAPEPRSDLSLAAELHFGARSKATDDFWLQETANYQADSIPALSGNKAKSTANSSDLDTRVIHHTTELNYIDLQSRSREINASPLAVWQTAWALLLSSYSETQSGDVMFGSVVSNRFDELSAVCHGPTFSMLPCRIQIATKDGRDQSVRQLVAGVARTSARILAHPHPSLGLITTAEGKLPFDSLLALQHFEIDRRADQRTVPLWDEISWPAMRNDFGVMLEVWPYDPRVPRCRWNCDSSMSVKMTFKTDLLSVKAASHILEQLTGIVGLISSRPELTASETLGLLPTSLLSAENMNATQLQDGSMLLHSQFELEAVSNPDKIALSFTHSITERPFELTYGELNAQADVFARRIHRHFVEKAPIDNIIPICLEKSPELYVAVLGILKAGGAWCPIDTSFPAQRKLELIQRTGSTLLVSSKSSQQFIEGSLTGVTSLLLVDEITPGTEPLEQLAPVEMLPEHLAYLIWTSGTTGAPKGVMIEHTAASHAMRALQQSIPTSTDKKTGKACPPRVLNFCAYSFDVFVQDLFYTWGLGGTVISSTREIMLGNFVQLATSMQATHAHLTPSFSASVRRKDLGDALQVVTMIGEKLTEQVADDWSWNTKAYNTYGPAENAVVSTLRQFTGPDDEAKAANVGWSLTSVSSFVVEAEPPHRLVPFYGVGELALGGHQLARGYLNDPAKTKARFVWSQDLQQRIYLTGDVVRMVDHGIEFLGRNDDLIKLNGIRVELSEISATLADISEDIEHIETLLLAHPDRPVKAVVSFASIRDNAADAPLVAADKRASDLRKQIVNAAHQLLPDYMVPSSLVLLNQMPRTASNKVDRKVLQGTYESLDLDHLSTTLMGTSTESNTGPSRKRVRTVTEDKVVEMLSILANIDAGIITDDMSLARLGIHSILAIRLAWQLKKEADVEISVVDLLRCSTIGQLLDKVSSGTDRGLDDEHGKASRWLDDVERQLFDKFASKLESLSAPGTLAIEKLLPATAMQESLVVETLRNDRSYWSHRMFRLPKVDLAKLRAAWERVAQDNEILRTSFVVPAEVDSDAMTWLKQIAIESAILQAVATTADVRWTELEWDPSAETLSTIAGEEARRAREQASPIASTQLVCPWSISVLKSTETSERVMIWHIHHALHDACSMDAMLDDVLTYYHGKSYEAHDRTQFGDAMRLGIYLTQDQAEEAQEHARRLYGGLVEDLGPITTTRCPDLTASRQPQPHQILRTSVKISRSESAQTWSDLEATMSQYNLGSPAHIISAAFGCVLAEYLESKFVVLGETVSQRLFDAKLQTAIGPLIATVPRAVRIDVSTAELLSSMASKSSAGPGALSHVQPSALRNMLGVPSDQPLYPALIVYHPRTNDDGAIDAVDQNGCRFWDEMEDLVGLRVEHSLALNIFEEHTGEGLHLELSGDNQVISTQQLDLMLSQIMSQVELMLKRPETPLGELNNYLSEPLLSITPAEGSSRSVLQSLVQDSSWTGIADPNVNPVAWVEYHARHHPDWVAVEEIVDLDEPEETRRWTYSQLLANAARVLAALQERAVPKGSVVSLHLGRTLESFAAIIALFRGGYIYLPLDEELPSERSRMLTIDAGAKAFITTQDLWDELIIDDEAQWADNVELLHMEDVFNKPDLRSVAAELPLYDATKHSTDDGYILYTSGSTGKPKGVRVTNYNICSFIETFGKRILDNSPETAKLGGVGKYLNIASRAFDPHLTHMFMAWRLGLATTIGPRMMMLGNLESVIVQNSITHFGTVPSVLQQARLSPDRVPSVVFVTVGGEKVSTDVLDMWTRVDDDERSGPLMMNVYGPTECTIGCTSNIVDRQSNARNIGKVFDSASAVVFAIEDSKEDEKRLIAKRGQTGELCIAGDLVSLGYLSRPDAEAKAFITAELPLGVNGAMQTTRLYKTGDLVRMMADGCIEYLGRSDQQAKVNGQRLELGEVEHFLRRTAEVLQIQLEFAAAVIQHPDLPRPRLFAFTASSVTAGEGPLTTVAGDLDVQPKFSDACSTSLPAFMIPDIIWVNRIPYMKASGKVDMKQLTALVRGLPLSQLHRGDRDSGIGLDAAAQEPLSLSDHEMTVVQAIEQVVGKTIERPNAGRSIYELGIDSLSAVQLSARLKQLGFQVSAANVLNDATIRNLAQRHSASSAGHNDAAAVQNAAERVQLFEQTHRVEVTARLGDIVQQVLPALPLQGALLARSMARIEDDDEDAASGVPYVTHFRYSLAASTDLVRFTKAIHAVLQEEEMLRTCFVQTGTGDIAQIVLTESPVNDLIVKARSSWNSWSVPGRIDTVGRALVQDIGRLPPVRVHLFEGAPAEVLISMHHSLFDGDAIKQMRDRIQEQYDSEAATGTHMASLKQLAIHFEAQDVIASQNFWQDNLAHAVPCLVDDSATSETQMTSLTRSKRRLSLSLITLQEAAQNNGTSLNALFQTAFALLLSELLPSRSEVTFGSVLSLRPLLSSDINNVEGLIAPCLNTLPQRVHIRGPGQKAISLRELAHSVRENLSATTQHAFTPLNRILGWCQLDQALFDAVISVNMHSHERFSGSRASEGASPYSMTLKDTISITNVPFAADVNIHSRPHEDGYVEVELSSSSVKLSMDKISILAERFDELCSMLANHPETQSSSLLPAQAQNDRSEATAPSQIESVDDADSWSADELLVRGVVCDLLKFPTQNLAKQESFYRLGLDSILVLRMVKLLRERAGVKLSPVAVLRARNVAAVAKLMSSSRTASSSKKQMPPMQRDDDYDITVSKLFGKVMQIEGSYLATPMQQGMLSAGLSHPSGAGPPDSPYVYRHTFEVHDRTTFDLQSFQKAWRRTVDQVEILRTTFHFTGDKDHPWLGIVRHANDDFSQILVLKTTEEVANSPLDIDVSVCLARCAFVIPDAMSEPITVVFAMHHAIYDGASLPLLWRVFVDNYHILSSDPQVRMAPKASFSHVAKQIAVQQPPTVGYWTKQLDGYTFEPLPSINADSTRVVRHRSEVTMPTTEYADVRSKCRELGVTTQAALLLAWSKVLAAQVLGQSDVVFGQVLNGQFLSLESSSADQEHSTADSTIGPTLNTIAMRVTLTPGLCNRQALEHTQRLSEEAQQHQVASLRTVQNEWRSSTPSSVATTLFESLFLFNSEGHDEGQATDSKSNFWKPSTLKSEADQDGFAEYPVVCNLSASHDGLVVRVSTASDKLDITTAKKLALSFAATLSQQMTDLDAACVPADCPVQKRHVRSDQPSDSSKTLPSTNEASQEDAGLYDTVLQAVRDLIPDSARIIDTNTNLFSVGLDSILAIRLSSKLRRTDVPLTVNEIMQGKTVSAAVAKKKKAFARKAGHHDPRGPAQAVASKLLDPKQESEAVARLGWPVAELESVLPCLAGQEHHLEYWMFAGRRFFEAPWIYKLTQKLTVQDVQSAWDTLRKRHAILRTSFVAVPAQEVGGRFKAVQISRKPDYIDSTSDGTLTIVQSCGSATLDGLIVQHLQKTNSKPSDLVLPPPRLALLQTSEGESAVVMRLHHAMYDAWSIRLLLRDFDTLLAGRQILHSTFKLKDSVQDIVQQRKRHEEQAFWSAELKSAQKTVLSPLSQEPSSIGPLGPQHLVRLQSIVPAATIRSLESLSQSKASSSLSPAILLAFAKTLSETCASTCSSPTFGFYHASRSLGLLDLTEAIMPTMTLTPLSIDVSTITPTATEDAMIDTIQRIQTYLSNLTQHGQASMHDILRTINNNKDINEPLFNAYINLLYRESAITTNSNQFEVLEKFTPSSNTYFTDSEPSYEAAPTLQGLTTSHIAPLRLFVDVVIDKTTNGISLGIRCDRALYDVEHIHAFAQRFVDKIVETERVLSGKTMTEEVIPTPQSQAGKEVKAAVEEIKEVPSSTLRTSASEPVLAKPEESTSWKSITGKLFRRNSRKA